MANFSSHIVYFHATDANNDHHGLVLKVVDDAASGTAYIGEQTNVDAAVALYGAGELRRSANAVVFPVTVEGGVAKVAGVLDSYYDEASGTIKHDPIRVAFPFRTGFREAHNRLDAFTDLALRLYHNYHPDDVGLVLRVLHLLHPGHFVVWHRPTAGVANLKPMTLADKATYLRRTVLGPADVYPADWAEVAKRGQQIYDPARPQTVATIVALARESGAPLVAPAHPITVVNVDPADTTEAPTYLQRYTLAQMLAASPVVGDPPTTAQLDEGRWVEGINA